MIQTTISSSSIHPNFARIAATLLLGAACVLGGCDSDDETTPGSGAAGSGSGTGSGTGSGGGATGTGGSGDGGAGASGGAGGDSSGSGGAGSWESYCADIVAREAMCDPDNPPTPTLEECTAAEACFDALFRDDAREPLMECLRTRPCDKSDDACFSEVGAALPETAEQQAYQTTCADKLTACAGGFSDDWCTGGDVPWQLFTPAVHTDLTACFSQTCDQVADCLEAALDATLEPCGGEIGF